MNKEIMDKIVRILAILGIAAILLFSGFVAGDTTQLFRNYNNMKVRTVYRDTCLEINKTLNK